MSRRRRGLPVREITYLITMVAALVMLIMYKSSCGQSVGVFFQVMEETEMERKQGN